jgi:hypothetical protein
VILEEVTQQFQEKCRTLHPIPSLKTVYNWYHSGVISYKDCVKRYRKKVKGEAIDGRKSIHQRSIDFNFFMDEYEKPGHYEILYLHLEKCLMPFKNTL